MSGSAAPAEQFDSESARLGKRKRIGYIDVSAPDSDVSDAEIMKEILPDLPEGETFRPEEMVREYLGNRAKEKEEPAPARKKEKSKKPAAAKKAPPQDYSDRSESGFSFEEALHPTENLEDIMRDLGLFEE